MANEKKDTCSVNVHSVNADDYRLVQSTQIPISAFVRNCFKKEADRIRAEQSKK